MSDIALANTVLSAPPVDTVLEYLKSRFPFGQVVTFEHAFIRARSLSVATPCKEANAAEARKDFVRWERRAVVPDYIDSCFKAASRDRKQYGLDPSRFP